MSSNNDNAMTRFLFAILKQKNLKDIDWNKVAHDPILIQEISNGHAARMRYSRFRAGMLGIEPTRRNRTGPPKSRATKSKKQLKSKKVDNVKSETSATPESPPMASPEPPQQQLPAQQKIKQENAAYNYTNRMTPALTPGPVSVPTTVMPNTTMIQNRFLTPCSDTDTFSPSPALLSSPVSEMVDFNTPPCPEHIDPTWTHNNSYFAAAYHFEDYPNPPCDHQHLLHSQCHLGLPSQSIETEIGQVDLKREWSPYD